MRKQLVTAILDLDGEKALFLRGRWQPWPRALGSERGSDGTAFADEDGWGFPGNRGPTSDLRHPGFERGPRCGRGRAGGRRAAGRAHGEPLELFGLGRLVLRDNQWYRQHRDWGEPARGRHRHDRGYRYARSVRHGGLPPPRHGLPLLWS